MRRVALLLVLTGCGSADFTVLSGMGLYEDIDTEKIARDVDAFAPRFTLWTDGASKQRWMRLPEGEQRFDTADPQHWLFPVGARFFKEFGRGGKKIETRVVSRESEDEWFMGSYVWRADQRDADLAEQGMLNADGQGYEVPNKDACIACHQSEPSRVLGFSPAQIRDLAYPEEVPQPIRKGLGYLHANCGHCHNDQGFAWQYNDMILKMDVNGDQLDPTRVLESVLGKVASSGLARIEPGDPKRSAIIDRMTRTDRTRMPPLGTQEHDTHGIELVTNMIEALAE